MVVTPPPSSERPHKMFTLMNKPWVFTLKELCSRLLHSWRRIKRVLFRTRLVVFDCMSIAMLGSNPFVPHKVKFHRVLFPSHISSPHWRNSEHLTYLWRLRAQRRPCLPSGLVARLSPCGQASPATLESRASREDPVLRCSSRTDRTVSEVSACRAS